MKKKDYKILIDMDNTLNDFYDGWIRELDHLGYEVTKNYKNNYHLNEEINGVSALAGKEIVHKIFMLNRFWENLPLLDENAQEVFLKLCKDFDVYILTAPYPPKTNCPELKINWIYRFFPDFPKEKILFASNKEKHKITGNCLIEDNPSNLNNFKNTTIAMHWPYNKDVNIAYRAKNWEDVEKLFYEDEIWKKEIEVKGVKFDFEKLDWSLVDFESLEPLVEVLMFGAKKYEPDNWKKVKPPERYIKSLLRHILEYGQRLKNKKKGDLILDKESNLPLIGHILCNAMFLAYFEQHKEI